MESILISICTFFILFSGGVNFNIQETIPSAQAEEKQFENHLIPSKRIDFPYRLRGVSVYDANLLTAKSAIVIDEKTGRVLFEKDSYDKQSIASLTKMMSVLIWWEEDGDLEKIIEIKPEDYREGGISYFIAGEKVRTKDLLYSALIASSNSAIAALARSTDLKQDDFIRLMNIKAEEFGMKNTRFKEMTGLDYKNISTATDMFILARELFKNPVMLSAMQMKEYKFKPIGKYNWRIVRNTNWLLYGGLNEEEYEVVGGKTGYIDESGYNLAIKIHSNQKNEDLIVIILGSAGKDLRFKEAEELAKWAFGNYLWKSSYKL